MLLEKSIFAVHMRTIEQSIPIEGWDIAVLVQIIPEIVFLITDVELSAMSDPQLFLVLFRLHCRLALVAWVQLVEVLLHEVVNVSAGDLHQGVVARLQKDDVLLVEVGEKCVTEDEVEELPVAGD